MQGECTVCGRMGRVRKGMCDAHYFRLRRTGSAGAPAVRRKTPGLLCEVDGCETKRRTNGMCSMHHARMRRHGDPLKVRISCAPGPRNVMWSGDQVGYSALHGRIRRGLGRAAIYVCSCGERAQEWAYRGGDPCEKVSPGGWRYSTDLMYYTAMCVRCHRRADGNPIGGRG